MLRKIMLGVVCYCALTVLPCQADDVIFGPYPLFSEASQGLYGPYRNSLSSFEQKDRLVQEEGINVQLAGEKQEGALSLFVVRDRFSVEGNNPFEEDLNALSPAAGIQFTVDFNL